MTSFLSRLDKWHKEFNAAQLDEDEEGAKQPHNNDVRTEAIETCEGRLRGPKENAWLSSRRDSTQKTTRKQYGPRRKNIPETPTVTATNATMVTPSSPDLYPTPKSSQGPEDYTFGYSPRAAHVARRSGSTREQCPESRLAIHCRHRDRFPQFSFDLSQRVCYRPNSYESTVLDAEAILTGFLAATAESEGPRRWAGTPPKSERGAKSLMALCQKQMAENMVQEQKENDELSDGYDGQVDVVGMMLQDLEDHYGNAKTGWAPLRGITRACGMTLVCRSIRTGALRLNAARELAIQAFTSPLLADFGEAITKVMIEVQPVTSPSTNREDLFCCHGMPGLMALSHYHHGSRDTWRKEFKKRMLLEAFGRQQDGLSLEWLSCQNRPHLAQAIKLTRRKSQLAAGEMIEVIYSRALGLPEGEDISHLRFHKRRETTTKDQPPRNLQRESSAISARLHDTLRTGIAGLVSLGQMDGGVVSRMLLDRMCRKIQLHLELLGPTALSDSQQVIASELLFGNICCSLIVESGAPDWILATFERVLEESLWRPRIISALVSMLLGGVSSGREGHGSLDLKAFQNLVQQLIGLATRSCKQSSLFMATVAVDAALELARSRCLSRLLDWASNMQQVYTTALQNQAATPLTPSMGQNGRGYRWDDVLEEWIAKTPATALHKRTQLDTAATTVASLTVHDESRSTQSSDEGDESEPRKKRRRPRQDLERYRDGDFEYSKPKRTRVSNAQRWSGRCSKMESRPEGSQLERNERGWPLQMEVKACAQRMELPVRADVHVGHTLKRWAMLMEDASEDELAILGE